jgi:hypothetical protein
MYNRHVIFLSTLTFADVYEISHHKAAYDNSIYAHKMLKSSRMLALKWEKYRDGSWNFLTKYLVQHARQMFRKVAYKVHDVLIFVDRFKFNNARCFKSQTATGPKY